MPIMDGFESCRAMRKYEKDHNYERKVIIGVSANSAERMAGDADRLVWVVIIYINYIVYCKLFSLGLKGWG